MEILHPWHAHPLFLSDQAEFGDQCSICSIRFDGNPFYACVDCKYYVHKSCSQLPVEIQHRFHQPHSLALCFGYDFYCDSCHKRFDNELRFRCSACDFDLDVKCALMSHIDTEGKEFISHFTHQHPLTICSKDGDNPLICFACKKTSSDLIYGCTPCDYFLHKSCSELSTHVLHAMHPQHALSLGVRSSHCNFCRIYDHAWKYYCSICDFFLDVPCIIESAKDAQNSERSCFVCGKQHLDSDSCINSLYFINQSCIQLPEEIEHEFHSHKLMLLLGGREGFGCDSCHKWFVWQSHYGCEECNFRMDVKCALMPSIQYEGSDESIWPVIPHHFNHQHPLHLIREVHDINCSACQTTKLSPMYGCVKCEYFLHQSCLELPIHIKHPLHDSHVLTIQRCYHHYFCHICCRKYDGFALGCAQCLFFIGIECIFEHRPTVMYKYHLHPLCVIEKSYCDLCDACNTFCQLSQASSEFKLTKSYSLRCIKCDYNLHFLCGPLPCTIKHKSHIHALNLVDSIVEDDSNEYYCDMCEEMRNPRLCVYYCEDCKFLAHVHCVISEIINIFKKNLENVELRIMGDLRFEDDINLAHDNLREEILLDVLNSLDATDMHKLGDYFPYGNLFLREKVDEREMPKLSFDYYPMSYLDELCFYSDDIHDKIWGGLESFKPDTKYQIERDECNLPVIEVQSYKVTSNFVPLFKALLLKHSNFGCRYEETENVKSVGLYFLCRVVSDMRRTYAEDITEKQLFTWLYYVKGTSLIGFDLDFMFPFLDRIIDSYVGFQAMKFENEADSRVERDIEKITKKILDLEIDKKTLELHRNSYRPGEIAEKSSAMKQAFTVAKQQKYKIAGAGIV